MKKTGSYGNLNSVEKDESLSADSEDGDSGTKVYQGARKVSKLAVVSGTGVSWVTFVCLSYAFENDDYIQSWAISYAVYFVTYYSVRFMEQK